MTPSSALWQSAEKLEELSPSAHLWSITVLEFAALEASLREFFTQNLHPEWAEVASLLAALQGEGLETYWQQLPTVLKRRFEKGPFVASVSFLQQFFDPRGARLNFRDWSLLLGLYQNRLQEKPVVEALVALQELDRYRSLTSSTELPLARQALRDFCRKAQALHPGLGPERFGSEAEERPEFQAA